MRRVIINAAIGRWYKDGQRRLVRTLGEHGYAGDFLTWSDGYPKDSPTHQDVPYAFKVYAFLEAFERGYDTVLWLDCSLVALRDVGPIFDAIERDGYYGVLDNQKVGEWLSDGAMEGMGIRDRGEWMEARSLLIGCFGLRRCPDTEDFLREWKSLADDGRTFHGRSENDGSVSRDPRVRGTRWEQTAASVLFHRRNMVGVYPPDDNMVEDGHGTPNEKTFFICRRRCSSGE